MANVLGMNGKCYRNTGTYAVPTWVEITNIKDLTLSMETAEADLTTRANNGFRATQSTLIDASVEFDMVWDTADANFTAFRTAFFAKTNVELLVLDGAYDTAGSTGLRGTMSVLNFSRSENLEEGMMASVSFKPGYDLDNAPEWYTATT